MDGFPVQPDRGRLSVFLRRRRLKPAAFAWLEAPYSVQPRSIRVFPARSLAASLALLAAVSVGLPLRGVPAATAQGYGLGLTPGEAEVSAWDISISQDGEGLPVGRGTVEQGSEVYSIRCAECHGDSGEGGDAEALAGGHRTLRSPRPLKTVGSYWPYAPTVWDYVNRAMPFDRPGMLTTDQVYSVVAYVLFLNGIVERTAELNEGNLAEVIMPNRDSFVPAADLDPVVEPSRPGARAH